MALHPSRGYPLKFRKNKRSVNTMTKKTEVLSIRLNKEDKDYIGKYLNRESIEGMIGQIKRKEIEVRSKGVVFPGVDTNSPSVNTSEVSVNTNDCEGCPYITELDMSKFDEVCDFKGLDKQKALDRCVQMLWR